MGHLVFWYLQYQFERIRPIGIFGHEERLTSWRPLDKTRISIYINIQVSGSAVLIGLISD